MATKKANPTWTDVEATLADFDRAGLYALVQSLHAANKDAQDFLPTQLHLGKEALNPTKPASKAGSCPCVRESGQLGGECQERIAASAEALDTHEGRDDD